MESTVPAAAAPATSNNSKSYNSVSLSKSKSSSTTSTVDDDHYNISSPSPLSPPPCDKRSSMDELWKDINLAALHDHPSTAFRAGPPPTLQDFLAGDPPTSRNPSTSGSAADAAACSCSHRPPAFTILSLSSGSGFQYIGNSGGDLARSGAGVALPPPTPYSVKTFGPPCEPGLYKRKAVPENEGDDRGKRLMKNRESASRSRAKKQAYMDELEVELGHLQKENAKLRMQQLQLRLALPAAALLPKKTSLRRTLTAPF